MIPLENIIANPDLTQLKPPSRRGQYSAKRNRTYNNNNIITFDTETTSYIPDDGQYMSFVYIAMLCVNGHTYYCRNLHVFKEWLDVFNPENTLNVIYVHNLGFDFTFLQNVLEFDSVFARTAHKPIYARYKNWEFRCSYFLSQMSLANVGKYYDLPHAKLADGLDYRKRRHTATPLTSTEEDYCEKDVLVLYDYIKYMLQQAGGKYKKIPYTQTGFVRRFILERAKTDKEYHALRRLVRKTQPDLRLYQVFEKCYAGGYTHANFMAVTCGLYTHVKSYDFTSSYPAVMVRCKFPMGKFREVCAGFDKYLNDSEKYCCVGRFLLEDVRAKSDLCYISQHKIIRGSLKAGAVSNGRLYRAERLEMWLTNVDIDTIKMMYDCKITPLEMWYCDAGYLPKTIITSILELYGNKTKLKGIEDKKPLYLSSKQMVNSVYGMCVFNPFCDEITYNAGVWGTDPATPEKLWDYYNNAKTILPYQWGVFVTAWARNKLCNIAHQIGNDVLYMDTDSIKFIGDHDALFAADNELIHKENEQAAQALGLPFEMFAPADIKGSTHELGLWDFEHEYKSFKVLGAKRYCYTLPGDPELYPVVAGCPTDAMRTWLKLHNCNALLKPFRLDICLDTSESGKNVVHYHDKCDITIPVKDYKGAINREYIGFGVCLEKTTFDMSLCTDYLKFLEGFAGCDKKALIRKGVLAE